MGSKYRVCIHGNKEDFSYIHRRRVFLHGIKAEFSHMVKEANKQFRIFDICVITYLR